MELIFCILAAYGTVNIIANGSIFNCLRNWLANKCSPIHNLITCPMCLGFWLGLILGIFYGPFQYWNPLNGAFYSATTWVIHCFVQFLGGGYDPARTINLVKQEPDKIMEEEKL